MDQTATNIIAYIAFVSGVAGTIYSAINRGHIRSMCCGRVLEASIVLDRLPPSPAGATAPAPPPPIVIPPPNAEV